MSNYISAIRLPNYEDYQDYEQTSCTLKHWPDLWPEEDYAEKSVCEWLKELRVEGARIRMSLQTSVLVQLCNESGWHVFHVTEDGRKLYRIFPDE